MKRTPVESSRIASIGWQDNTLEVEFVSKKGINPIYQYQPVSKEQHDNLLTSFQPGVEMQKIIADKGIICTKL